MIEILIISMMAVLAVTSYVFKTQRDHARRDAEQKKREADACAEIIRVAEERRKFGTLGEGINGQLRRNHDRR